MNEDLILLLKEFKIDFDILPMDFFSSEEISVDYEAPKEENNTFSANAISIEKYNFRSNEIKIPVKSISRIIDPKYIIQ